MRFRFESRWQVDAPPSRVRPVLADVAAYPTWWPQVRAVARISETSGLAICRSLAPFSLRLLLEEEVSTATLLRVGVGGDLSGWCQFALEEQHGRTDLRFTQEVEVVRPLLRVVSGPLRPVLRGNHAWMMRGCRLGLQQALGEE